MRNAELKRQIEKKQLKANTLEHVVFRMDFLRIIDIKDFVESIQELFNEKGLMLDERLDTEIELSINDPENLITNELIINNRSERGAFYKFTNKEKTIGIVINRFFIMLDISCYANYNSDIYIEFFSEIIYRLKKQYVHIDFIRIGFRKINGVVCKNPRSIYKCFEKDYFNSLPFNLKSNLKNLNFVDNLSYIKNELVDNFILNGISFNLLRSIIEGEYRLEKKDVTAFKVILDIEGYIKDDIPTDEFNNKEKIIDIINNINENIFCVFREMITFEFIEDLVVGKTDKVLEGVNTNE